MPSVDTLYRDLCRFDDEAVTALEEYVATHGLDREALRRHREHHLDIDTSVLSLTGNHERAAIGYNPQRHRRPSLHPILARSAELDTCVGAFLRPGDTAFGTDDAPQVERIVKRYKAALTAKQELYVRIDGAGDCTALMSWIAAAGARFVTKARLTKDLRDAVSCTAACLDAERRLDCTSGGNSVVTVSPPAPSSRPSSRR